MGRGDYTSRRRDDDPGSVVGPEASSADAERSRAPSQCGRWRLLAADALLGSIPYPASREGKRLKRGPIAQLGEHLLCKEGVRSSSLLGSTIFSSRDGDLGTASVSYALPRSVRIRLSRPHIRRLAGASAASLARANLRKENPRASDMAIVYSPTPTSSRSPRHCGPDLSPYFGARTAPSTRGGEVAYLVGPITRRPPVRIRLPLPRIPPGPAPVCLLPGPAYNLIYSLTRDGTSSRGGAAAARRAHNPKVAGSNPAPATTSTVAGSRRRHSSQGGEVAHLVGLITRRSQVRILPLQPHRKRRGPGPSTG